MPIILASAGMDRAVGRLRLRKILACFVLGIDYLKKGKKRTFTSLTIKHYVTALALGCCEGIVLKPPNSVKSLQIYCSSQINSDKTKYEGQKTICNNKKKSIKFNFVASFEPFCGLASHD